MPKKKKEQQQEEKKKLVEYDKQFADVKEKLTKYMVMEEASIIACILKEPELIKDSDLTEENFDNHIWKLFFKIAHEIVIKEKKTVLDDITIGVFLESHKKLKDQFNEKDGYAEMAKLAQVDSKDFDSYVSKAKKWKALIKLLDKGFPIVQDFDKITNDSMSLDEIYNRYETYLNDTFITIDDEIKSYNAFEGIAELVEELDEGADIGLPFHNSPLLTNEVGGFSLEGNIYGLGGGSGQGKSTMAFNYLVPSAVEYGEKIVFIINEEDEKKFKKELLVWVANNVFLSKDDKFQKYKLRDGHFSKEDKELLLKCAKWIEEKKNEHTLTIIPLESYSVNTAIKIIKKYSSIGVKLFVLDTFKESVDAKDEMYRSMMRDMVKLYNVIKPSVRNVGLLVTYQLGKGSIKMRHLTNNEIGQAKSIMDVMSVNLMMRRPFDDEYEGEKNELKGFSYEGKNNKIKLVNKTLKKGKNYMITFITKNRRGATDEKQIVSECDLSTNRYKDVFYCNVPQDW